MKKLISFFRREINKNMLLSIIPLVVVLFSLAMPAAWSANVALSSSIEKWPAASDAWPAEAWPECQGSNSGFTKWPATQEAWPTSESESFIALRTVVLNPVDRNEAFISADVVFVDEEYKIEYRGHLYKITPLLGNPHYDSQVEIDGIIYVFNLKLRPYE